MIRLLDCTLRDGGYVNDWQFTHDTILSVYERLVSSGVDVIEIGFLDERRPFDIDRTIMPDTDSVEKIYGSINKKSAMIVGMIDFGTCGIENISPCAQSYLDGIRVIFKQSKMVPALNFCKQLKDIGYKVFTQAVSITSYTDKDLHELFRLVNEVEPFAFSMVDTYGLLHQDNLLHILRIADNDLKPNIVIGYHAHNNFQMGYANCIEVLSCGINRDILVDATLYGMGKSAGNTPIELIAMYMNEHFEKHYDINQMLEAIDCSVMDIYRHTPWGYNLFYYISAKNKCHPNYVSYLLNKKTLSVKSVNDILYGIEKSKKLLYDKDYIEQLYIDYQHNECNDTSDFTSLYGELKGKSLLLVGPGSTVAHQKDLVKAFAASNKPTVLSINYIPDFIAPEYIFITNSKRYAQMSTKLVSSADRFVTIATSNITGAGIGFSYMLNYKNLIDSQTEIPDNSLIMLLRVLEKCNVKELFLAGFDGYCSDKINYAISEHEYDFAKEKADYLNAYASDYIRELKKKIPIAFITESIYEQLI